MCLLAMGVAGTIIPWHLRKIRFDRAARITGGDPHKGIKLIERNGCGACHIIPGIPNATGLVAPDLTRVRARTTIAGVLENRPENMRRWIMNPQMIDENTSMPNLGISAEHAGDIVAYLYSLE